MNNTNPMTMRSAPLIRSLRDKGNRSATKIDLKITRGKFVAIRLRVMPTRSCRTTGNLLHRRRRCVVRHCTVALDDNNQHGGLLPDSIHTSVAVKYKK